jgi:uncharacterized membrane protein
MQALVLFLFLATLVTAGAVVVIALILFLKNRNLSQRAEFQQKVLSAVRDHLEALDARVGNLERRGVQPARPGAEGPDSAARETVASEPEADEAPERPIAAPPPTGVETAAARPAPAPSPATSAPPSVPKTPAPALPKKEGIERQLGTKVAVWLGAIALALSGAFLVKYSFEQGLIGPAARVVLGLVFGVALLGVAEWLHRRAAGVARGLAAAGIAVLYAALLAGVRLYDLIPPPVGLVGLALVTGTAVVLALRHGQIVAILGLLGGFVTPVFLHTGEQNPWQLLFYLVLLQVALLGVSRRRRWWPLAGLTLVAVMAWALLWMSDVAVGGGGTLPIALLLTTSIVSFIVAAESATRGETSGDDWMRRALVWGATGVGIVLLAALVDVGEFGLLEWSFLGIVGAGCIVLGRLDAGHGGLAWFASITGAVMLLIWGADLDSSQFIRVWWLATVFAALYVGGAYLAMWGSTNPGRWAALASVSGIVYFLAAYAGTGDGYLRIPWGVQAIVLAAVFVCLAIPVARRRERLAHGDVALTALALGATALVSLSVPMELERGWFTVAWALEIPALAWIGMRLRLPDLRKIAWPLAGLVALRLLLNPAVFDYPMGQGLVLNWLLYGYGVPIAAFVVGAVLYRRYGSSVFADVLEVGAMAFGFAYLSLSIRQYFHPGDLAESHVAFAEWGAFTVVWLLYGLALLWLHRATERRLHMLAGASVGLLALAQGLLVQGLALNPLAVAHDVGETLIFNRLLFVYGLPSILAVVLARFFRRLGLRIPSWTAGSMALVFGLLTLSLEVRQAFHGNLLNQGGTTNAEMYTYSLVWVLFAIALLVAGIATRGVVLRYGSAVVMALAVVKVFLVDTANLRDLYRVFSLFGLGITLMLLAYLYQRFVFRERER